MLMHTNLANKKKKTHRQQLRGHEIHKMPQEFPREQSKMLIIKYNNVCTNIPCDNLWQT